MRAKYLLSVALMVLIGLGLGGCAWLFAPRITADLSATPTSGEAPLSVTFDLSGSTGNIVSFTLSFDDGSSPATGTDITTTVVNTYDDAGTYTAQLTVQDARGRTATDTATITVSEPETPPGPTATLGVDDANPLAGQELTFYVVGSAPAGKKIVYWSLDFDDGTEIEKTPEVTTLDTEENHTYTATGTYVAELTVEDEDGATATDTVTVTVSSPPPEISDFTVDNPDSGAGTEGDPYVVTKDAAVEFTFDAEPGAGRKIVKWQISFGDTGSYSKIVDEDSLFSVSHILSGGYEQTGSYTATARVWDDLDATDSASVEIDVE